MEIEVSDIKEPEVKEKPEKVLTFEIDLAHGRFAMEDAFELRTHAIAVGNASEVIWNGISDQHKDVLTQICRRALEVLHANVERFLPNVITGAPGDMVNINIKVLLSKIEEQVEIIQSANEFERNAAKRQMIADLMGDIEPLTDEDFLEHVKQSLAHGVPVPNDAVERVLIYLGAMEPDVDTA